MVPIRRVMRGARFRRSVDRNSFRSPRGARDSGNVQPRPLGSTFVRTAINSQSSSALAEVVEAPAGRNSMARGRAPRVVTRRVAPVLRRASRSAVARCWVTPSGTAFQVSTT
jgi:hypothetical protein